jgi:hypothetical protein
MLHTGIKRVEFVSDRVSYIILRGRWCDIIVLNDHAPKEDKTDDVKDSFHQELEGLFDKLTKFCINSFLRDFNAKFVKEELFKGTIPNDNLHEINNDNGVNFATSKKMTVKNAMFQHRNIHKFAWTFPDGQTHNQIDHILIDRRRHSSVLDIHLLRAADCDIDHYLVVAIFKQRLAVRKKKDSQISNGEA